jgi:hypothetical protein
VERIVFSFQPVRYGIHTGGADVVVEIEEQREVGEETLRAPHVEGGDVVGAQTAPVPLISQRGIHVAVAQHHLAVLQRRSDDLLHQVGAGRRVKQSLRPCRHAAMSGIEQHAADIFAQRSPSGLARHQDHVAALPKPLGQQIHLRGLATAVETLEGDEDAPITAAHAGQHGLIERGVLGERRQRGEGVVHRCTVKPR